MAYSIYDATLGSLALKQVTAFNFTNNGSPVEGAFSGQLDVAEYFAGQSDLRASATTEDIASVAALSSFISAGLKIVAGTITAPLQKRDELGTFESGANHVTLSGANGLLIPTSIDLPNGGNATVGLELIPVSSDGVTVPIAFNTAQSLASQAFTGLYTVGPVSINATTIDQNIGVTINPGLSVEAVFYNGGNYLTDVGVRITRRRPMIEVRSEDAAALSALGAAWGTGTAIVVYGRKRSGNSFVADATAQHVKITGADGIIKPRQLSVSGSGSATNAIQFWPESLTFTGSQAIV